MDMNTGYRDAFFSVPCLALRALLRFAGFSVCFPAVIIKEPAVIKQSNLATVALKEGAHHLVAEPFWQHDLLLGTLCE